MKHFLMRFNLIDVIGGKKHGHGHGHGHHGGGIGIIFGGGKLTRVLFNDLY